MLILQRKPGEAVRIGDDITISILSVENGRVRVAIDAPTSVPILRSELIEAIAVNQDSVVSDTSADELMALLGHSSESAAPSERKDD